VPARRLSERADSGRPEKPSGSHPVYEPDEDEQRFFPVPTPPETRPEEPCHTERMRKTLAVNENRSQHATPSVQASLCRPGMCQKTLAVNENRSHHATPSVQASLGILRIAMTHRIGKLTPLPRRKKVNCKTGCKNTNILFVDKLVPKIQDTKKKTRVYSRPIWKKAFGQKRTIQPFGNINHRMPR